MAMLASRLIELNNYYYLLSGLRHGSQVWPNIDVKIGSPNDFPDVSLPSVIIDLKMTPLEPFELGTESYTRKDQITISALTKRDGQRDSLGEYIKYLFSNTSKDLLDFNEGFPPIGGQSSLGKINYTFIDMFPVRKYSSLQRANMHRLDLRIQSEFTT
jgi:hypothetical protein